MRALSLRVVCAQRRKWRALQDSQNIADRNLGRGPRKDVPALVPAA